MPPDAGEIRIRGHFCALKPNLERRGCLVQALQDQAPQPGTEQKNTALEQAENRLPAWELVLFRPKIPPWERQEKAPPWGELK